MKSIAEPIVINDELTLLKVSDLYMNSKKKKELCSLDCLGFHCQGRVSTFDVFGVANSDLVAGQYEGEILFIYLLLSSCLL